LKKAAIVDGGYVLNPFRLALFLESRDQKPYPECCEAESESTADDNPEIGMPYKLFGSRAHQ
jgi:hypothetical protein